MKNKRENLMIDFESVLQRGPRTSINKIDSKGSRKDIWRKKKVAETEGQKTKCLS
jgi:hypothetical protein